MPLPYLPVYSNHWAFNGAPDMSIFDSVNVWQRYWADLHDGSRRLQLEHAARAPLGHWLVADAATLVEDDEYGLDPTALEAEPDAVLAAARDGFAAFVEESGLERLSDSRYGYDVVPIHLTTVLRLASIDPGGVDPVADVNTLALLPRASVVERPTVSVRAVVVTYQCPRDHETSVRQPLLGHWAVETCGEAGCDLPVVPDHTRTRTRRVCRFTVEADDARFQCVATGRYAEPTGEAERLAGAGVLALTGVLRPVIGDEEAVEPTLEVLHAETV